MLTARCGRHIVTNDFHITVEFGKGIPADVQGRALLALEKMIREQGIPAEVFKHTRPDDSVLRSKMTPLERAKL